MRRVTPVLLAAAVVLLAASILIGFFRHPLPGSGGDEAEQKPPPPVEPGLPFDAEPDRDPVVELPGNEPGVVVRPISTAKSVMAIFGHPGFGFRDARVLLVVWTDGRLVWSSDRSGDPPYRAGRVDPKKVAVLLALFKHDGLFAEPKLNGGHVAIDAPYDAILVRSGAHQVRMTSSHEIYEPGGRLVDDDISVRVLDGRRRLEVLRETKAERLFYRFVWSETRGRLMDLIPPESTPVEGKAFLEAGGVYWRGPAALPKGPERQPEK